MQWLFAFIQVEAGRLYNKLSVRPSSLEVIPAVIEKVWKNTKWATEHQVTVSCLGFEGLFLYSCYSK